MNAYDQNPDSILALTNITSCFVTKLSELSEENINTREQPLFIKEVFKGFHITYITYHNEKILSDHNTKLLDYNSFQRRQLPNTLSESCGIILYMTSKM